MYHTRFPWGLCLSDEASRHLHWACPSGHAQRLTGKRGVFNLEQQWLSHTRLAAYRTCVPCLSTRWCKRSELQTERQIHPSCWEPAVAKKTGVSTIGWQPCWRPSWPLMSSPSRLCSLWTCQLLHLPETTFHVPWKSCKVRLKISCTRMHIIRRPDVSHRQNPSTTSWLFSLGQPVGMRGECRGLQSVFNYSALWGKSWTSSSGFAQSGRSKGPHWGSGHVAMGRPSCQEERLMAV